MSTFDRYERRAHVAPALTTAAPGIVLLVTGGVSVTTTGGPIAIVVGGAIIAVCAAIRDRGKALEPRLWQEWGGAPTTQLLRWNGTTDVAETTELHAHVEAVTGIALPDAAAEAHDGESADRVYDRAVKRLRSLTSKDEDFPLLKTENANYGWRRNLLGLRPIGIAASVAVFVASVGLGLLASQPRYIVPALVAVAAATGWIRLDGSWVRLAADRYADQLVATLEVLRRDRPNPVAPTSPGGPDGSAGSA